MLSGTGRIYAGAEKKSRRLSVERRHMNKGKPMLHRSKKPIQIVIKRLWSISAGVCFWSSFFHIFDF